MAPIFKVLCCIGFLFNFAVTSSINEDSNQDATESSKESVTENRFYAIEQKKLGSIEYLQTDLPGLIQMSLNYLPSTLQFIGIVQATREIINGVRYEMLVQTHDIESNEIYCKLVILEQPWIITEYGERLRISQFNNCSDDAQIEAVINHDKIQPAKLTDPNEEDHPLDDIEALLIYGQDETVTEDRSTVTETDAVNTITSTEKPLSESALNILDSLFIMPQSDITTEQKRLNPNREYEREQQDEEIYVKKLILPKQSEGEEQVLRNVNYTKYELTGEENSENLSITPVHRSDEKLVGGVVEVDSTERDEILQIAAEAIAALNDGEQIQGVSINKEKLRKVTKQVVAGFLYTIEGEFISGDSAKDCTLTIWSRPWMPQGNEVTLNCNDEKDLRQKRYRRSVDIEENMRTPDASVLFEKFKLKYNKKFHSRLHEKHRFKIFRSNLEKIKELNENELGTAKYGITEFTDLTDSEFNRYKGLLAREEGNEIGNPLADIPDFKLPKSFDWREKGVITEVKNQGNCGSCWAFSVTGNIEGLHAVKTGQLEEYSEQELLDCDSVDKACGGGLPDNAYKAIEQIGGLELESEYPYQASKSQCSFNKTLAHVKVKGAIDFPKNETAMALWLVANGPISIGINANAMQFYRGGISHPWKLLCRPGGIDHGVLIVGYGVSEYPVFNKTLPYWIVKNSWGPEWGEQGYYRVFRGDNTCGINSMASSAVLY